MLHSSAEPPAYDRLESWKDIAAYLQREVRTVQLWEKTEGLPVHRHAHRKRGTVYAYKTELDAWRNGRRGVHGEQSAAPVPAPRYHWPFKLSGVLGLCVACAVVWLATVRRPPRPLEQPDIVPLTSDHGREMGASFSPDGKQVAFAWKREGKADFDIYLKTIGSDQSLQLTNTAGSDEVDPAWSPNGRDIAFYRTRADARCGTYTIASLGGPERLSFELRAQISECWGANNEKLSTAQPSWSPDGKWLALPGISLVSESGERRELTSSPLGLPDLYPTFSPEGRSVAFVRWVNADVQDLYVVSVAGGEPTRIPTQRQRIYGVTWTSDGNEIVYSSGKWDWAESALWRVARSGKSAAQRMAGGERAWLPAMSTGGRRLAFTRKLSDTSIWQVTAPGAGQRSGARRLIASTQAEGSPALSPNGQRVAFVSDRSGRWQIWVCDRNGSNVTQMTSFVGPGTAGQPVWSLDGRRIAFAASVQGNEDIYVISSHGGTPARLTTDTSPQHAPSWSQEGQWLYFASERTGRPEIWKLPLRGGSAIQVTKHGGQRPVESPDAKFVYYEKGPNYPYEFQPWRVPVDGGPEEPLVNNLGSRWTAANDGLYYYHKDTAGIPGTWFLNFLEFASGKHHVVVPLAGKPLLGHRPAVSPDRRTFLYAQLDLNETDVMLLENFR